MRKLDHVLKDYTFRLSTDSLKYLSGRLAQRIGPDMSEAIEAMSSCQEIDKWLSSAKSCWDFYDMVDKVQEYVDRELVKRIPDLIEV